MLVFWKWVPRRTCCFGSCLRSVNCSVSITVYCSPLPLIPTAPSSRYPNWRLSPTHPPTWQTVRLLNTAQHSTQTSADRDRCQMQFPLDSATGFQACQIQLNCQDQRSVSMEIDSGFSYYGDNILTSITSAGPHAERRKGMCNALCNKWWPCRLLCCHGDH